MRWLFVALLGAGLGVTAGVSDAQIRTDHSPAIYALSLATGLVSVWAAAAILGGAVVAHAKLAVLAGPLVIAMGVIGYYAAGAVHRDRVDLSLADLGPQAAYWLAAALFLGPVLGLIGGMMAASNLAGLLARLVAPVALVIEMMIRHPISGADFRVTPTDAWTSLALIALGCLGALFAIAGQTAASQ